MFAMAGVFGWMLVRLPAQWRAVRLYNAALQNLLRGRDDLFWRRFLRASFVVASSR
jgi:hypothetical protein